MASDNQTPAPKVSGKTRDKNDGQRKEPAVELESGLEMALAQQRDEGLLAAETNLEQQQEQNEKSEHGKKSLEIPYGREGEGKKGDK